MAKFYERLIKLLYNIRNVSLSIFLNCLLIIPGISIAFFAASVHWNDTPKIILDESTFFDCFCIFGAIRKSNCPRTKSCGMPSVISMDKRNYLRLSIDNRSRNVRVFSSRDEFLVRDKEVVPNIDWSTVPLNP